MTVCGGGKKHHFKSVSFSLSYVSFPLKFYVVLAVTDHATPLSDFEPNDLFANSSSGLGSEASDIS